MGSKGLIISMPVADDDLAAEPIIYNYSVIPQGIPLKRRDILHYTENYP